MARLRKKLKFPVFDEDIYNTICRNIKKYQFGKINVNNEDERQRLIDCFVNAVFVFDDKIVLTFNYKDDTKTIKLSDLQSSDLEGFGSPLKEPLKALKFQHFQRLLSLSFSLFYHQIMV